MGVGAKNMKTPIFLAFRALIKNRFDESSNLAHRDMYAKFQQIWIIRFLRAMGVVRKLTLHLIIGGNRYSFYHSLFCLVERVRIVLR